MLVEEILEVTKDLPVVLQSEWDQEMEDLAEELQLDHEPEADLPDFQWTQEELDEFARQAEYEKMSIEYFEQQPSWASLWFEKQ